MESLITRFNNLGTQTKFTLLTYQLGDNGIIQRLSDAGKYTDDQLIGLIEVRQGIEFSQTYRDYLFNYQYYASAMGNDATIVLDTYTHNTNIIKGKYVIKTLDKTGDTMQQVHMGIQQQF